MLSVICPIYNEAKYIDVCIQSILLQDYPKKTLGSVICGWHEPGW
jgi:glycosyltransferase involved in cell wall biosynthesis